MLACRLDDKEVEMGLGIHGEPGAYKREMTTAGEMVEEVSDTDACVVALHSNQPLQPTFCAQTVAYVDNIHQLPFSLIPPAQIFSMRTRGLASFAANFYPH